MVIRASRAGEVERLVSALLDAGGTTRDAAVARLRVIGSRALARLASFLATDAPPEARVAAFKALEGIDDPRTLDPGLTGLAHPDPDVAVAAIGVLRRWLLRERGTRVLDALSAAALDGSRDARVRVAALDALSELPRNVVQPLLQQVPPSLRDAEARAAGKTGAIDDPIAAREWLATHHDAPLSELHQFIVRARDAEKQASSARRRQDWQMTRAGAHAVLAQRGSRVALYDLRETFDAARGPLPVDFLAAATTVGDATCLEPMARAWAASPAGETWWRERLADAAADIMHRTRLSGRSHVVKRIRTKWTGFL